MQVAVYVSLAQAAEEQLQAAFTRLSARYPKDADIRDGSKHLAEWSRRHAEELAKLTQLYGAAPVDDTPQKLGKQFLRTRQPNGLGLLRDLQDMVLLATQVELAWTVLMQAALSLHDHETEALCKTAQSHTTRQLDWLRSHIKLGAPQALLGVPDPR